MPAAPTAGTAEREGLMNHIKVADLMTGEVISVAPGTALKEAVKVPAQYDIGGVPLLDDGDRVVGVRSQTDVLALTAPDPHTHAATRLRPDAEIRRRAVASRVTARSDDAATTAARGGRSAMPW
ncbi:hypothetical protein PL81_37315 [Streptomyces sp. RSD-27]|nr:hypothetical protein PL81_37315 [Streptomyces sp. RSD-27]